MVRNFDWFGHRPDLIADRIQHMREQHAGYDDEGRVISEDRYAELVHTLDHERNEGIVVPHTH